MIAEEGIRYLAHEAKLCRDKDTHEALCLLLPAMLRLLCLEPMDDFEALDFAIKMRDELRDQQILQPATVA